MCYTSFENSDLLTQHFTSVHDNDAGSNENNTTNVASEVIATNALSINPAVESVLFANIFILCLVFRVEFSWLMYLDLDLQSNFYYKVSFRIP